MTPRWTAGINGSLMWWAEGDEYGPALYPVDLGAIWDAWRKDAVTEAFDALVAAVRDQARIPELETDAETLRQIRAEFESYEDLVGDPYDMSRFVGFLGEIFLSSPAPQGEGCDG